MTGGNRSVEVSAIVAGRILQAAGLAAWVLAHGGDAEAASACREIQDVVDDALSTGARDLLCIASDVAGRAVELWERAARQLTTQGADAEVQRRAEQLQHRASELRARLVKGHDSRA